ncbi:glycosyl hydrolase 108 family protein [Tistrella bauzanensis]|uniref:glycosyl hydrolase 108 family protein n=1 Tax=Tistrella TaxID=171436 RepID=UPI0031F6C539
MEQNLATAFRVTMAVEGGQRFVDHPSDPGGATKWGVSLRLARRLGLDLDGDGDVDVDDIRLISEPVAQRVFDQVFWQAVRADDLPAGLDLATADAAFHHGDLAARRLVQRAAGVTADGIIGPITLKACHADRMEVLRRLGGVRLVYMSTLPGWGTFGEGWGSRVVDVHAAAQDLAVGRI